MLPLQHRENTCCFTGHRPAKLPWRFREEDPRCIRLKGKIYDVVDSLYEAGIRNFICGMAMGCDMYFAEQVLRLRELRDDVALEAALPCETQADTWPDAQRSRYITLLDACDHKTLLQHAYTKNCMRRRNEYMVDRSSVLLAVYNGTFGGTLQTINYAQKKQLEIITFPPC